LKRRVPSWHHQAIELVEEIGKRTTTITGDPKEMAYLFQQLQLYPRHFEGEKRFLFKVPSLPASPSVNFSFTYCLCACLAVWWVSLNNTHSGRDRFDVRKVFLVLLQLFNFNLKC